jgi:hypothetical protein
LAGFTPTGSRDDFLHVTGLPQARQWRSRPESTGFEVDLYRVELGDVEPDTLENEFAKIETQVAPILAQIIDMQSLPDERDRRCS